MSASSPQLPDQTPSAPTSYLAHAGTALVSIARHVPTRAAVWAGFGLLLGLLAVLVSLVLAALTLEGGVARLFAGGLFVVPLLLPLIGMAVFGWLGLYRGAARAALAIEAQFGLVAQVVTRLMEFVQLGIGTSLANLPLAKAERVLKEAIRRYLGSDELKRGGGLGGWVLRQAKRLITDRVETYLLSAFRAEVSANGGGGIDLVKVRDRAIEEVSAQLQERLMQPLNQQIGIASVLFLIVGSGWFHLGLGIVRGVGALMR